MYICIHKHVKRFLFHFLCLKFNNSAILSTNNESDRLPLLPINSSNDNFWFSSFFVGNHIYH